MLDHKMKDFKELTHIAGAIPPLDCIHIKDGLIEASNGFVLVQKPIDYKGELLVKAADFRKAEDLPSTSEQGNYPNTTRLYPTSTPSATTVLNKSRLKALLKCFPEDDAIVEISIYDKRTVVQFEFRSPYGEPYGKGLIMPVLPAGRRYPEGC